MKIQHARTGAVLLSSQAASSLLNFIPSAVALLTLNDMNVATMAVSITGYILAVSVGRSLFGEALLVLAERKGEKWAHSAANAIRMSLIAVSLTLLGIDLALQSVLGTTSISWLLTLAVATAMMSHDTRRYELIARRLEHRVLLRDVLLTTGTTGALLVTWKAFDETVNLYLGAWCLVAIVSSIDLVRSGHDLGFGAAKEAIKTGRSFGFDLLANRVAILVVAVIAREAAGDASLADAEAQRLTMAVVNIAFLGAGPISLLGLPGRRSVLGDSIRVSAALAMVAALWWSFVSIVTSVGRDSLPSIFEPWSFGVQWKVLLWFVAAAIPFGYRYRLRTALASRTIFIAASAEAVGGTIAVAIAVAADWVTTASGIFALYFVTGAIGWIIMSWNHSRIERTHLGVSTVSPAQAL